MRTGKATSTTRGGIIKKKCKSRALFLKKKKKKAQLLEWRRRKRLQKWQRVQAVEVVVLLFFVCFVLLLAARATKTTTSGQNAAFGRSRLLVVNLPTGAAISSRLSTGVWQHCALVHGAMLLEPFVPAGRAPPNDVFFRERSSRPRPRGEATLFVYDIHSSRLCRRQHNPRNATQDIPLRHLSKVSV